MIFFLLCIIILTYLWYKFDKNKKEVRKLEAELDDIEHQLKQNPNNQTLQQRRYEVVRILKLDYPKTTKHKYDNYKF